MRRYHARTLSRSLSLCFIFLSHRRFAGTLIRSAGNSKTPVSTQTSATLGLTFVRFEVCALVESVERLNPRDFCCGAVDERTIGEQLRDQTGRISSPDGGR